MRRRERIYLPENVVKTTRIADNVYETTIDGMVFKVVTRILPMPIVFDYENGKDLKKLMAEEKAKRERFYM